MRINKEILKRIPYEQNEHKIRSLITPEIGRDLLSYSTTTVQSENMKTVYLLFKICPNQVDHMSPRLTKDIICLIGVLEELCKPCGMTEELCQAALDFGESFGVDRFRDSKSFERICGNFAREVQDFPMDVIAEGFRRYQLNYNPPIYLNVLMEMMTSLFNKRRTLLESLHTIMKNVQPVKLKEGAHG